MLKLKIEEQELIQTLITSPAYKLLEEKVFKSIADFQVGRILKASNDLVRDEKLKYDGIAFFLNDLNQFKQSITKPNKEK